MRRTTKEVDLAGHAIPANAELLISVTAMLRDPAMYPDPLRFDPDRWLPERAKEIPRALFMPFGAGTRKCSGEPLARISMALTLATVAPRFRLRPVAGVEVREVARGTMSPSAMPMTVEARESRVSASA
jgi:cytochrome P450